MLHERGICPVNKQIVKALQEFLNICLEFQFYPSHQPTKSSIPSAIVVVPSLPSIRSYFNMLMRIEANIVNMDPELSSPLVEHLPVFKYLANLVCIDTNLSRENKCKLISSSELKYLRKRNSQSKQYSMERPPFNRIQL